MAEAGDFGESQGDLRREERRSNDADDAGGGSIESPFFPKEYRFSAFILLPPPPGRVEGDLLADLPTKVQQRERHQMARLPRPVLVLLAI